MISVLFVDDEPNLRDGLKRMFQKRRAEWSMRFAASGAEALEMLVTAPADVVVSDMAMPGMSGAELLARIKRAHPETILIILSGQCDRGTALRTVDPAHLHLSKPCNPTELSTAIERTYRLRRMLAGFRARQGGQADRSITESPIYTELVRMLRDPDVEIEAIAALIERDDDLTKKLLKVINTTFDGASWSARSPLQTINLLGLDLVRGLILDITRSADSPSRPSPIA
jgi:DNA-binding NarL/FixJ family response regulator